MHSKKSIIAKTEARIAKRSQVRNLVESVIAKPDGLGQEALTTPESTPATPPSAESTPATPPGSDSALQSWKRTKQWFDNTTLQGINANRIAAVIEARVEAAFRAGYAAGVGDSI